MTKITFTRNAGGHNAGDTTEVTAGAATLLINAGYAEANTATPKRKPKADTDTADNTPGGDSPAESAKTAG